ncbi:hypothetical protein [Acinetobacter sp. RF14B]|uniref:hypothetical protein n=1 Tax=Acinetobacter sp. RF14B TaxID=2650965 RepID=UPI00116E8181|nr:hypothetical protein [Acinetobacter sp. RF14B]TQR71043.1 hypothetical protein E2K52_03225 [Acinetobacter sp. RF14B]
MALDQIWKQQLTLVTYGNEFLTQDLGFSQWLNHSIFNQHHLTFRDLLSQHLLAQHFQIWLEGLKKQGVHRLSLHSSHLLEDEKNPNANVELVPFAHVIISHGKQEKMAWMIGKELAEWYSADNDYEAPPAQQSPLRHETFWGYQLNSKLAKRINADLEAPNWDDIQTYTEQELFQNRWAQGFTEPTYSSLPYYGSIPALQADSNTHLALIPTNYSADYVHQTLYRLEALSDFIDSQIQHPYHAEGEILSPEQQLDLRHFSQKIDDLTAKFIVKVANHYKTAQLSSKATPDPFAGMTTDKHVSASSKAHKPQDPGKSSATNVLTLIIITVIICLIGYYFGL